MWETVKADKIEKDLKEYRERKLRYLSQKGPEEKVSEESNQEMMKRSEDEDIEHKLRKRNDQIEFERRDRPQREEKKFEESDLNRGEERFDERNREEKFLDRPQERYEERNRGEERRFEESNLNQGERKGQDKFDERNRFEESGRKKEDEGFLDKRFREERKEPYRHDDTFDWRNEGEDYSKEREEEERKMKEREFDTQERNYEYENARRNEEHFHQPPLQRGERNLLSQKDGVNPREERNYEAYPKTEPKNLHDQNEEERMKFQYQKDRNNFDFGAKPATARDQQNQFGGETRARDQNQFGGQTRARDQQNQFGGNVGEEYRVGDENFEFQKGQQTEGIRKEGYIHPETQQTSTNINNKNENIYQNEFDRKKPNNLNAGERNMNMGVGI